LQLKRQLRKANFYPLPTNKELEEYLRRTGQSIQDLWKDPKLAQGLNAEMVITPRFIEWKKEESSPVRKVYFDRPGVIQYCTNVTGTLRTSFTLWHASDGVKVFENEILTTRQTRECTPDLSIAGAPPKTSTKTEEKAVKTKPGAIVPDPFLTGALDATWESDAFFESVVKKAVSSFIDNIDPSPVREMSIAANDIIDYKSGRQLATARKYLRDSNWAAALKVLEQMQDKHPDSYAVQYLMGIAQQGQLDFELAKKSFERAFALCQSKPEASTPEEAADRAADCEHIAEAYRNSQTWNMDVSPKDVPAVK
jgi:tetratricopeptide (TPR) repeat protein